MRNLRIRSASEQVADFLKEQIQSRSWTGKMPGESQLVTQLQIGRNTVRAAMTQLEKEGLVVSDGQGKSRRIVMKRGAFSPRNLRVRIFLYEMRDQGDTDSSSLLAQLLEAGFDAKYAAKSLKDLGMQVERVARHVNQNPADAWVIVAGSREVLEWFANQTTPALAMYGRSAGLPIAAAFPQMIPGQTAAVRRLIELGHKRIVMLTREERRKPKLSHPEQVFIDELAAAGIATGDFNLPDWEESPEGLNRLLNGLFRVSPPTALIFQEAQIFIAARTYLADRGIIAPRDVSLVVAGLDQSFSWCDPVPSHMDWDFHPVVKSIVRWAKNVARGKINRRHSGFESKFVEGGTIGPVNMKG